MDKINDGGPAFPCEIEVDAAYNGHNNGKSIERHQGMTLRDYFAAKALNGLVSGPRTWPSDADYKYMAEMAYEIAGAMLRAREEA